MPRHAHGFTLIEILIVVAIMGILGAIAYPSYTEYVLRGHRSQARASLQEAGQWMERVATANGTYPITTDAGQKKAIEAVQTQLSNARYGLTIASTDRASYVVQAAPAGSQLADKCGTLSLDQTGKRGTTNMPKGSSATAAECWAR